MKLKVGNTICLNVYLKMFWKVIRIYKQDKVRAEIKMRALGSNHTIYGLGQVIRWTVHKSHIKIVPKLRYELLRDEK